MCRNHSHLQVKAAIGAQFPDGSRGYVVTLEADDLTLEYPSTGEKLTVPRCSTLYMLLPSPVVASLSPDLVMAGLAALLFAWEADAYVLGDMTRIN